jgi:hypothetical protein
MYLPTPTQVSLRTHHLGRYAQYFIFCSKQVGTYSEDPTMYIHSMYVALVFMYVNEKQ